MQNGKEVYTLVLRVKDTYDNIFNHGLIYLTECYETLCCSGYPWCTISIEYHPWPYRGVPPRFGDNLWGYHPVWSGRDGEKFSTFAIPGNIDTPDVGQAISESNALNIDRRRLVRNGVSFVGLGGERFSRPSDLVIVDDTIKKPIADVLDANSVLVTHVPPYQLQDTVFLGHHTGNKELRDIVETCQPRLVLCGHIHEDPGMTKFGKSTIVNCSIGKRTEGAVINIDDGISVEILE